MPSGPRSGAAAQTPIRVALAAKWSASTTTSKARQEVDEERTARPRWQTKDFTGRCGVGCYAHAGRRQAFAYPLRMRKKNGVVRPRQWRCPVAFSFAYIGKRMLEISPAFHTPGRRWRFAHADLADDDRFASAPFGCRGSSRCAPPTRRKRTMATGRPGLRRACCCRSGAATPSMAC